LGTQNGQALTSEEEYKLRKLGRLAARRLAYRLLMDYPELIDLAVRRALEQGAEYEGASYRKTKEQLLVEGDEELADAIFYEHLRIS